MSDCDDDNFNSVFLFLSISFYIFLCRERCFLVNCLVREWYVWLFDDACTFALSIVFRWWSKEEKGKKRDRSARRENLKRYFANFKKSSKKKKKKKRESKTKRSKVKWSEVKWGEVKRRKGVASRCASDVCKHEKDWNWVGGRVGGEGNTRGVKGRNEWTNKYDE